MPPLPILIGGVLSAGFWLAMACVAKLAGENSLAIAFTVSTALCAWSARFAWTEMRSA
jgi:hypothetical protein